MRTAGYRTTDQRSFAASVRPPPCSRSRPRRAAGWRARQAVGFAAKPAPQRGLLEGACEVTIGPPPLYFFVSNLKLKTSVARMMNSMNLTNWLRFALACPSGDNAGSASSAQDSERACVQCGHTRASLRISSAQYGHRRRRLSCGCDRPAKLLRRDSNDG